MAEQRELLAQPQCSADVCATGVDAVETMLLASNAGWWRFAKKQASGAGEWESLPGYAILGAALQLALETRIRSTASASRASHGGDLRWRRRHTLAMVLMVPMGARQPGDLRRGVREDRGDTRRASA